MVISPTKVNLPGRFKSDPEVVEGFAAVVFPSPFFPRPLHPQPATEHVHVNISLTFNYVCM